jgi:hypothetical protein
MERVNAHHARMCAARGLSLCSLGFGDDSSNQNTAEYTTKVLGVVGLARMGVRDIPLHLIGDNMSALSWARKGRAKGELARNAVLVFVLITQELGITVASTSHLRGILNTVCDGLSRGKSAVEVNLPPELVSNLDEDPLVQRALALCNPAFDSSTKEGMRRLWLGARELAVDLREASLLAMP